MVPTHRPGFWAVAVIALLLVALVGATGHWSPGFWIALGLLVLVGALFPLPAAIFGGSALLYLGLTHGRQFIANVTGLLGQAPASPGGQQP